MPLAQLCNAELTTLLLPPLQVPPLLTALTPPLLEAMFAETHAKTIVKLFLTLATVQLMNNTQASKIAKCTVLVLDTSQLETSMTSLETLLDAELTTPLLPLSLPTLPPTAHTRVPLEQMFAENGAVFTANLFKITAKEATLNTKTLLHA